MRKRLVYRANMPRSFYVHFLKKKRSKKNIFKKDTNEDKDEVNNLNIFILLVEFENGRQFDSGEKIVEELKAIIRKGQKILKQKTRNSRKNSMKLVEEEVFFQIVQVVLL